MSAVGLPSPVQHAIEQILEPVPLRELRDAAERISRRYRDPAPRRPPLLRTSAERLAYLAVRAPATYAVARTVLGETAERLPELAPVSMLDVGSGPGSATWAAVHQWPELQHLDQIESDAHLADLARQVARTSAIHDARTTASRVASLPTPDLPHADIVCASYMIGELQHEQLRRAIRDLWEATRQVLVIIEPGTPRGFQVISEARRTLLDHDAAILAPCPAPHACPKVPGESWCHFAVRLPRTRTHRQIKQGTLAYEDEKYSYLAVSRSDGRPAAARVLSTPTRSSGLVRLELCEAPELTERTFTRRNGPTYRAARKLRWGSAAPRDLARRDGPEAVG